MHIIVNRVSTFGAFLYDCQVAKEPSLDKIHFHWRLNLNAIYKAFYVVTVVTEVGEGLVPIT